MIDATPVVKLEPIDDEFAISPGTLHALNDDKMSLFDLDDYVASLPGSPIIDLLRHTSLPCPTLIAPL